MISKAEFGLRKCLGQGTMFMVRRFFGFLQYGTSARLAAPRNCMPAPEYALPRESRVRINGTLNAWRKAVFAASASERLESGRDGAETLRAPAAPCAGSS